MSADPTITEFFDNYAAAFTECDISAIAELWQFPAYITTEGASAAYEEPQAFKKNIVQLCDFYQRQGMAYAQKAVLQTQPLYPRLVMVRTKDELFDGNDRVITSWEHSYIMRLTGTGWKAIAAFADGEIAAWRANGTPLGED